jgi:hypothetical protein
MPDFSPPHPPTSGILQRPCPKCGTIMMLTRMTPDGPGYQQTFECPACDHSELEVVRFN